MSVIQVASATSATLLVDTKATGYTITNTDANDLFIALGDNTVSTSKYTVKIASGAYYETPYRYRGAVYGIWSADGSGNANITAVG